MKPPLPGRDPYFQVFDSSPSLQTGKINTLATPVLGIITMDGEMPEKGTPGSTCYDVKAAGIMAEDWSLMRTGVESELMTWTTQWEKVFKDEPFFYKTIYRTGIKLEIPKGYHVIAKARSSVHKQWAILSNGIGEIDEDYKGELMAVFYSLRPRPYEIGDKIIQISMEKKLNFAVQLISQSQQTESERGSGRFGSTGK